MSLSSLLKLSLSVTALLLAFGLVQTAGAQVTINFTYDGTDTVSTFNVATNTFPSNLHNGGTGSYIGHELNSGGYISLHNAYQIYGDGTISINNSAWNSTLQATSFSGDTFAIADGGYVNVSIGYDLTTGAALTGSMTWANTDLVTLGFASNSNASGSFTLHGAAVNWSATNTSAVPEPSTYAALVGLAVLGFVAYRRRAQRA